MSSTHPFEIIPIQRLKAGERSTLDLGLFFDMEAVDIALMDTEGVSAMWGQESGELILTTASGESHLGNLHFLVTAKEEGSPSHVDVPLVVEKSLYHVFRYAPDLPVQSLSVAGDFNGWNSSADPMVDEDGDGTYTARVEIEPGMHTYKLVLNGEWMPDPTNPEKTSDGWDNSIIHIQGSVDGEPPIWARSDVTEQDGSVQLHFLVESPTEGRSGDPAAPQVQAYLDSRRLDNEAIEVKVSDVDRTLAEVIVTLPAGSDAKQLRVQGISGYGDILLDQLVLLSDGRPVAEDNGVETWRSSILYYAMVDRFNGSDDTNNHPVPDPEGIYTKTNWMGGDLQGIIDKLNEGYFTDLGVTCLWLSPLNEQTPNGYQEYPAPHRHYTAYHGYWPISNDTVEPRFGTAETLHELVDLAHEQGIKVILDFVSNHVHEDHPIYAEHPEWFESCELADGTMNIQKFDEYRFTTWFDVFLPTINYPDAPDAIEEMTDVAMWWLTEFNLDGFRHDAVKHIPHEFWTTLTRKVRAYEMETGREIFQVGETISDRETIMEYCRGGMLDGQFDFPTYWPFRQAIATREGPMTQLSENTMLSLETYGPEPMHSALIGNHDVPRFMALADGHLTGNEAVEEQRLYGFENDVTVRDPESYELLKVAFANIMTQPEIPMIFYGDEVGLTGAQDPDNRRMMEFEGLTSDRVAVRDLVSRLTAIRTQHPALWNGGMLSLHADEDTWVYARVNFDEIILVALNRADSPASLEVDLPSVLTLDGGQRFSDLLGDGDIPVRDGGAVTIPVGPRGFRLLHLGR